MGSEQIDDLFSQTLIGDLDDESPWAAIRNLRSIGSRDVFDRAAEWCNSDTPLKRARGASVLAQLGSTIGHPENNFPDESFSVISALVHREKNTAPLSSMVHALGHIGNPLAIPLIIEHRLHQTADVRFSVACALGNFANEPRAVAALLALMQDADEDVRDWATFGLGTQGDVDSQEIRDALFQRISDPHRNVREEAMAGLGKRKDKRALPALIAELSEPEISDCVREAAKSFLIESEQKEHWTSNDYIAALKKQCSP